MQVNINDSLPILILHVPDRNVSQNTSIVDQNVNPPKSLDGSLDDLVAILNGIVIGNRFRSSLG